MFINITDKKNADNKGSSSQLIHYLNKEQRTIDIQPIETWFDGKSVDHDSYKVRSTIDSNIAKLGRDDSKFFLINISPSQKEIAHLKQLYGQDGAKTQMKNYAIVVMDEYAKNFNRPGITNNEDLLWFGKLENFRYFTHLDKEVKSGQVKRGDRKPGEQMHIQVIVSRKDISNKVKLSPMNTSRGKNKEHSKIMGEFNRSAFKSSGELIFDKMFNYQRNIEETFNYANIQMKASVERKQHFFEQDRSSPYIKDQNVPTIEGLLGEEKNIELDRSMSLLDIALSKAEYDPMVIIPKKKKKRLGAQQQTGRSL
jgi:hypothetical protein